MLSTRVCAVCHKKALKEDLIRIVKQGDHYFIDDTYKMDGRGSYVCKDINCLTSARKKSALKRSFKAYVPDTIYDQLEAYGKSQN